MKTFELETLTYGTIGEQEVQVAKKRKICIFSLTNKNCLKYNKVQRHFKVLA